MPRHYYTFIQGLRESVVRAESGESIPDTVLAPTLKLLTEIEVEEGGPYAIPGYPPDLATNLTIACFLCACGVRLAKLDAFIESGVAYTATERELWNILSRLRLRSVVSSRKSPGYAPGIHERIIELADERLQCLPCDLAQTARYLVDRTIKGNNDMQMSQIAVYMREALGERGKYFDDEYIALLGLINIFFWSAFIVYDDFWDGDEAAEPRLLPVANLFARHYTELFSTVLLKGQGFGNLFRELMDKLDAANVWEIAHCRMKRNGRTILIPEELPSYGDFAIKFYPAAGHVLGPIAMLSILGYDATSDEVAALIEYFKHYLIAMQINDDMHDWREDLQRGHISTAVFTLLQEWRLRHPDRVSIDLEKDLPALEQLFWFDCIKQLCEAVLSHTQRSRDALRTLSIIENLSPLEQFIDSNEHIAHMALKEYETSTEIMQAFSSVSNL